MRTTASPWILILIGTALIGLPMLLAFLDAGHLGKPGRFRDAFQSAVRGIDPGTMHSFLTGLRIGVEAAGAILVGIGVMRSLGIPV
jgi:hypothetical protein